MLTNKKIGILVIFLSLAFLITLISLTIQLEESTVCPSEQTGEGCPHESYIPPATFFGTIFIIILISIGIVLLFVKPVEIKEINWKKYLRGLKGEEKKIYKIIGESGGYLMQSKLVEQSGFSKVKVSRILDSLETKGLVERRRRGMSNVVLLKS